VYSLGVVLYELLTGRLPFDGNAAKVLASSMTEQPPPPSEFRFDLDPDLEATCLKALAKKPAERIASMSNFAAALAKCLARLPGSAEQEGADDVPPLPELPANENRATVAGLDAILPPPLSLHDQPPREEEEERAPVAAPAPAPATAPAPAAAAPLPLQVAG